MDENWEENQENDQAPENQDNDINSSYLKFKKPFVWEDKTYEGVDLSGFEDIPARDLIQIQHSMERSGSTSLTPEMTVEYACLFASKATKMPVEFFQALPSKEAIRLKNRVTNFFYGED